MRNLPLLCLAAWMSMVVIRAAYADDVTRWQFDLGPGEAGSDFTRVAPDAKYSDVAGFGLIDPIGTSGGAITGVDRGGDPVCGDFCTSNEPFAFAVKLPEGNYRIAVTLGDAEAETTTTIHAEVRRLLAHRLYLAQGESGRFEAAVNIRTPRVAAGGEVRLKPRERAGEWPNWDDKLTLTFSGEHACVAGIEITRDDRCPTLYLMGDSTVADQASPPWNSWGQMLPRFFGPSIAVANHAESGETLRSALAERRFEKLYELLKNGDWVALQFGHNDMKATNADARGIYAKDLVAVVAAIRQRGATPILVTSMERKSGLHKDTLGGYPEAVRAVAKKLSVPLIDLHAMSQILYRGMGEDLDSAFQDETHHQAYGSYHLARCVVEGIRTSIPDLATHLAADAGPFDPAKPEPAASWGVPTKLP